MQKPLDISINTDFIQIVKIFVGQTPTFYSSACLYQTYDFYSILVLWDW